MKILQGFLIALIVTSASCSSSGKLISWQNENSRHKSYTKILVLGFMRGEDNSIRENAELLFSESLRKAGFNAASSLELFGTKVFDKMDEDDALFQLNNSCVDAVLTITLLNKNKELKYRPGIIHYTPYAYYYDRFWRYRNTINNRIYDPAYYNNASDFLIECNLYDMTTQKLLYSAQIGGDKTSIYPGFNNGYVQSIVNDLFRKKILLEQP